MTRSYEIPGADRIALDHLALDVNGTLTDRGKLIAGVAERLAQLAEELQLHLLSADTFGTLRRIATQLDAEPRRVSLGAEKRDFIGQLGPERCAAIGNGRNDRGMIESAALGIAVIGPEGGDASLLARADVVCGSVLVALDLLLDPAAMASTLRP